MFDDPGAAVVVEKGLAHGFVSGMHNGMAEVNEA